MLRLRFAILASAAVAAVAFTATPASAHRIFKLQGNQWAIVCDNGTGYSFSGSQAGAGDVAGLLCPPPSTQMTSGGDITFGTLEPAGRHVRLQRGRWIRVGAVEEASSSSVAFRGYPPHGYPCLGCAPCPGNPAEFCDTTGGIDKVGSTMRVHPGAAAVGWTRNAQGRLVRREQPKR